MVAVGDDVGIAVEGEERREPFDPFDDVAADQHPAFGREVVGNEQPQAVELVRDDELAPEVGQGDSALAAVDRLGVRVALREVEFLLRWCGRRPGRGSARRSRSRRA